MHLSGVQIENKSKFLFLYAEYSYIRYSFKQCSHCIKFEKNMGHINVILISGVFLYPIFLYPGSTVCIYFHTFQYQQQRPTRQVVLKDGTNA